MKYTIIKSFTGRSNWTTVGSANTWAEIWSIFCSLKQENPQFAYHIY